jgi:hypothetical protein
MRRANWIPQRMIRRKAMDSGIDAVHCPCRCKIDAKYPLVDIVPGSLRDGAAEGWGNKRIVTIRCVACNTERIVATSDLFHVYHCIPCAKRIKKEARKSQKESKKESRDEER